MKLQITPIGTIHSPFQEPPGTPIQGICSRGTEGTVHILPEYREGLQDLDGFSHIILLYWFHKSDGYRLKCRPFLDDTKRGLFATRAPRRPNPIGLSIVELISITDSTLAVRDLDIVDGTPLLDIKPYIDTFDVRKQVRTGWYQKAGKKHMTEADDRFTNKSKT
ncbi:MAG: tRNA (N6-threonylcarbamoyladenosine(37)-N6)-methyltransferase TrmO [Deltaproteobacteria bacterium]|nr:tRNA (N6-threonylcarbamoyladenosine(37)-N6)-methyltransferase TrmO [Deltaproteobacteria bacterium]